MIARALRDGEGSERSRARRAGTPHRGGRRRNARWRRAASLVALALSLDVGACTAPRDAVPTARERSVEGRSIEVLVRGDGTRALLVVASIHGDEPAGTPLVRRLARVLDEEPERARGLTVVLVPALNPDGLAAGSRTNARGVDLNRNWPAGNFAASGRHGDSALSEPESRALARLLEVHSPVLVVSFHQPLACVDYDGPAVEIAERVATAARLPVRKLGERPGSLGSYVGGELGIPVLTVELPRGAEREDDETLWRRYGPLLLQTLDEAFAR